MGLPLPASRPLARPLPGTSAFPLPTWKDVVETEAGAVRAPFPERALPYVPSGHTLSYGATPPHGVPLVSTLSATQRFPVTSLPRTSEPLHAGPQVLEEGQVWAHLCRRGVTGTPAQMQAGFSVLRRGRLSASRGPLQPRPLHFRQEETEGQRLPAPRALPLPLHLDRDASSPAEGPHPPLGPRQHSCQPALQVWGSGHPQRRSAFLPREQKRTRQLRGGQEEQCAHPYV